MLMKNQNIFLVYIVLIVTLFLVFTGCPINSKNDDSKPDDIPTNCVSIMDAGTHFNVTLDFTTGVTHYQMGQMLGNKIKTIFISKPQSYQSLIDSYVADIINSVATLSSGMPPSLIYYTAINRANALINRIPSDYKSEIDGLASTLCDIPSDSMNDGHLSKSELYMIELILDIGKASQCSAVSVFDSQSVTGGTITGRTLDWYTGSADQLPQIQAITNIKNGGKSVVLVGYLGYHAGLTILNDNHAFASILESTIPGTQPVTDFTNIRSYSMDLRYAMENYSSIDEVAEFMKDPVKQYVAGHLIFLSDPDVSKVLENNLYSGGTRALRVSTSALNNGITWGLNNALGCVNSFILQGNTDNHTVNPTNTARWDSMKTLLLSKRSPVSHEDIKQVMTYFTGSLPGNMEDGDLYNVNTQQIVIIEPGNSSMEIFFRPKTGSLPASPVFETYDISF